MERIGLSPEGMMSIKSEDFRAAMAAYATGVTVATAALPDGRRAGVTVNSFTSVSLEPPLVLFCLDRRAAAHEIFTAARGYAINVLQSNQEAVSRAFAKRGQGPERWEGLTTEVWESGAPVLRGCLATLDCLLEKQVEGGDHTILIGRVVRLARQEGQPLLYWGSGYKQLA
jgi:flavin reductase (DIM6/NTAB) family NADH-FMN oxidoreductase RutF